MPLDQSISDNDRRILRNSNYEEWPNKLSTERRSLTPYVMVTCSAISLENANYLGHDCIFQHICPRELLIELYYVSPCLFCRWWSTAMVPRVLGAIDRL
ncbi:hypothetical protein MTR_3g449460 [Medicago truncatula]|nr:hypothetical protein MTR_3g449460 [Medicago truncatula]